MCVVVCVCVICNINTIKIDFKYAFQPIIIKILINLYIILKKDT